MFSPVLETLFLRTRDQHAATGRAAFVAVVVLVLFHAAVLTPWVEYRRQLLTAAGEEQRFDDLAAEVAGLGETTAGIGPAWQDAMTPALEQLVAGLREDLARLEVTRKQLAAAAANPEDEAPEDGDNPEGGASAALPETGVRPFTIENPDWIAVIAEADNRYGLLAALDPAVEQLIVRPRFAELNRAWRDDALPGIEVTLDASAAGLARLRSGFREAGSEVGAQEAAITNLRRVFRDLEVRPPDQPYWWASPEATGSLDLTLPSEVERQLLEPAAFDEVSGAVEMVGDRQAALAERVETARQRSLAAHESREHRLGGFAATLAGVGVDLQAVVALFPLLLGLLLAALMMRRNQRLRELGLATHAMLADGGGSDSLRDWCLAQLQGGAIGPAGDAPAESAWRAGSLRALGALILALAWIALAAVQVRGLDGLDDRRWLAVTVLGAAAVLVATVHRLIVGRRLTVLLAGEPAAVPEPEWVPEADEMEPEPDEMMPETDEEAAAADEATEADETAEESVEATEADEEDGEIIAGHTLRR